MGLIFFSVKLDFFFESNILLENTFFLRNKKKTTYVGLVQLQNSLSIIQKALIHSHLCVVYAARERSSTVKEIPAKPSTKFVSFKEAVATSTC